MIKHIIILILILLVFCFSGFAAKVAVLPELMKPGVMAVDDTQLYVTQEASVFIYSLKDFKLVKKHLMIPIQYESELQFYPMKINKGKLYQIVENEEEELWEFHMSKIE